MRPSSKPFIRISRAAVQFRLIFPRNSGDEEKQECER